MAAVEPETEPIRVLYDISVLGAACVNERARTGVYRVVDSVARYLVNRPDIDVNWTAFGNAEHLFDAIELMKMDPSLRRPLITSLTARRFIDALASPIDYLAASHFYRLVRPMLPWIKLARERSTFNERQSQGFDIVHSPFHALPTLKRHGNRPIRVLTVYDLIPIKYPNFFEPGICKMLRRTISGLTRNDWVLAISESTRNDLLEHRNDLDPERIRVTPLAAADHFMPCDDPSRVEAVRRRIGVPPQARYFLSVCTLEPRKNLRHLIAVFDRVRRDCDDDTFLVLVGTKGWKIAELLADISDDSNGKILATGYVADEELAPLYSDAIAFVYPSLYEGFGLPPLEAMQCGTPVITSNNSSLPEVVGNAGLLVEANSADDLSEAMLRVYQDDSLRHKLAASGRERATLFSWDRCGQMTVNTYRDAIRMKGNDEKLAR